MKTIIFALALVFVIGCKTSVFEYDMYSDGSSQSVVNTGFNEKSTSNMGNAPKTKQTYAIPVGDKTKVITIETETVDFRLNNKSIQIQTNLR